MSVLIKGMKIPSGCCDCKFCTQSEYSSCILTGEFNYYEYWHNEKRNNCPLIDVAEKHGRLIDADELLTERMKTKYYHLPNGDIAIPIIDIEHAKTVIEAEGE